MKKFLCWLTDWIGWFFIETSSYLAALSNYDWAWADGADNWRWYMRPFGWVHDRIYWLGNYFYGLFWKND